MISICMIVKNESKVLEKSLESIKDYNFEIIIVDTGSSDNTKEIARKYTDKVYDFKWCNDFSQARNFSISKAANDFVLVLDADEVIIDIDLKQIEKLINKNSEKVGRIIIKNEYYRDGNKFTYKEYVNRLFNKNLFIYKGLIHEQVTTQNGKLFRTYNLPLEIHHIGYNNEEITRKNKIIRNIEMLKEALRENSEDPYIYYQLGKSYYMNDNFKEAKYNFETALSFNLDTKFEYVQDLIETYGYALINTGDYKKALDVLQYEKYFENSSDFIFLQALVFMNNGLFDMAVNSFKKATCFKTSKMEGVNSYLAYYNLGVIYECLGMLSEAIYYYNLCGDFNMAKNRLNNLIANNEVI